MDTKKKLFNSEIVFRKSIVIQSWPENILKHAEGTPMSLEIFWLCVGSPESPHCFTLQFEFLF